MAAISGISGLASGMDTTAMIDAIINAARTPTAQLETQSKEYQNRADLIRSFNTKMLTAQLDLGALKQSSTIATPTASSSDETTLTAAATSSAVSGSFQVTVDKVASAQQLISSGFASNGSPIGTGIVNLTVGAGAPVAITIDSSNNTLSGLADAINRAGAGVTAQLINDGSANPWRLSLASTSTGAANTISLDTSGLSGGSSSLLNTVSLSGTSTTSVSLSGASTSGAKMYQVQVADAGAVGVATYQVRSSTDGGTTWSAYSSAATSATGNISLDSGVSFAFSAAGTLNSGDVFTLRPLQQVSPAQDALIRYGSTTSSLSVTSASNTISNLIPGVTLNLKNQSANPITVSVRQSSANALSAVQTFITDYNAALDFWNQNASYDQTTGTGGPLFGESELVNNVNSMNFALTGSVTGIGSLNSLNQLGITFDDTSKHFVLDSTAFNSALASDPNAVAKVFANTGSSSNGLVQFAALSDKTKPGTYNVTITHPATQSTLTSDTLNNSISINSSNNQLHLALNGQEVNLTLASGTYTPATMAAHLQSLLNKASPTVKFITSIVNGKLEFRSNAYGSGQSVTVDVNSSAASALGLTGNNSLDGADVVGSIGGIKATGSGQVLSGAVGSSSEGLRLIITAAAPVPNTTVTISKGIAQQTDDAMQALTNASSGSLFTTADSYSTQVTDIATQVQKNDDVLAMKRTRLEAQFRAMETAMSQFTSVGSILASIGVTTSSNSTNSNTTKKTA